jgi:site-specific DNA-methyltransferase (adenine-specific)
VKLINGNCLDHLDEQVDLVLSDPPYNIGFTYNEYDDAMTEESYVEMLSRFQYPFRTVMIHYPEETMQYLVPALGVPEEVMVWCYNSNIGRQSRLINFFNCKPDKSKVLQPYKNPTDKRVAELIRKGRKGTPIYDWFSDIQLVKNVSKDKTAHPCPVPVALMERIILMTTKEGDTVMDPFMGSGTTGIACRNLNRKFIGIEIDKKYFEIAKGRLL